VHGLRLGSGSRLLRTRPAQLGDSPLRCGELRLEVVVLALDGSQSVDDLVEEVVDLVLVVTLAELRRLELLVQDVVFGRTWSSRWAVTDRLGSR
jgi:hypothetical protein